MRIVTWTVLFYFGVQVQTKQRVANQSGDAQDNSANLIDKMSDKLVDRALKAWHLQKLDLDSTTLEKGQGYSSIPRSIMHLPKYTPQLPSSFPSLFLPRLIGSRFPPRPPSQPPSLAEASFPFIPALFPVVANFSIPDWKDIWANASPEPNVAPGLIDCHTFEEFVQCPLAERHASPIRSVEFGFLRALFEEPDRKWKTPMNKNGIKIQRKFTSGSNSVLTRGFVEFPGIEPDVVLYNLIDIQARGEWDTMKFEYVGQGKQNDCKTIHASMPLPVVKDRDFVVYERVEAKGKDYSVLFRSTFNAKMLPLKKVVRGELHLGGARIYRPAGSKTTRFSVSSMIDPCGQLPTWLVNMFATKEMYESLQKLRSASERVQEAASKDPALRAKISACSADWRR